MVPYVSVRVLVGQQGTQAAQNTARLFYGPPSEARFAEAAHKKCGGGLRYAMNESERVNIRLDYGLGRGSSSFYFSVTEAF